MIKGIDCASPLTAAKCRTLKKSGYEFVGRYLVPARGTLKWKALTRQECEYIAGAGLKLLVVWETTADRPKGGAQAGLYDGAKAAELARELKMPETGIIYFAVDYDAQAGDYASIEAYLRAARSKTGEYEIGVYGSYGVIEAMAARGVCRGYWQCAAWSYGRESEHLTVYQKYAQRVAANHAVDINWCPDMDRAGMWDYEEATMTDARFAQLMENWMETKAKSAAPGWAEEELKEAIAMGITDGTRPMELVPRYQAAIMAVRAAKAAMEKGVKE